MERKVIQVEERPPLLLNIPLSIQHLFAMFGATVLVPFLFNVNPTTCLFMNGIGTLLYLFLTKGKIPSYLGSSFAFISPVMVILSTSSYSDAQSGFIVFGLIFILFSLIIKYTGTCLLYTSDDADDLLCVDLGGSRIINKKQARMRHDL